MTHATDLRDCRLCPLWEKQEADQHVVPPLVGANYQPGGIAVMLDSPGFYEAKQRQPLIRQTGSLFDDLAREAGMSRDDLLVQYMVRHRPPNNRLQDYPDAVAACSHWTQVEFGMYNPRLVILMGREVIQQLFGAEASVARTRGKFTPYPAKHPWGQRVYFGTYNPAAAAYQGGAYSEPGRLIVQDLKAALSIWRTMCDSSSTSAV